MWTGGLLEISQMYCPASSGVASVIRSVEEVEEVSTENLLLSNIMRVPVAM